jgi:hypothetical protein
MRIRLLNPHAQSKDPYNLIRTSGVRQFSPDCRVPHFSRPSREVGIFDDAPHRTVILSEACGFAF